MSASAPGMLSERDNDDRRLSGPSASELLAIAEESKASSWVCGGVGGDGPTTFSTDCGDLSDPFEIRMTLPSSVTAYSNEISKDSSEPIDRSELRERDREGGVSTVTDIMVSILRVYEVDNLKFKLKDFNFANPTVKRDHVTDHVPETRGPLAFNFEGQELMRTKRSLVASVLLSKMTLS